MAEVAQERPPTDVNGPFAEWAGYCPICQDDTVFRAKSGWFRRDLLCTKCHSIPRERAIMMAIANTLPDWPTLRIHESSPARRGTSLRLARDCAGYIETQFFPDSAPGTRHASGVRLENLEAQTFPDNSLDLVVTQDVMEHVFHPDRAYREIWRTLRPGGLYIHTTPLYKAMMTSERRAVQNDDGSITYLHEAEYHGNPVARSGSLVTFHYGYDLPDLIAEWTPFAVEVRRYVDRRHGVVAEFPEVIICHK